MSEQHVCDEWCNMPLANAKERAEMVITAIEAQAGHFFTHPAGEGYHTVQWLLKEMRAIAKED